MSCWESKHAYRYATHQILLLKLFQIFRDTDLNSSTATEHKRFVSTLHAHVCLHVCLVRLDTLGWLKKRTVPFTIHFIARIIQCACSDWNKEQCLSLSILLLGSFGVHVLTERTVPFTIYFIARIIQCACSDWNKEQCISLSILLLESFSVHVHRLAHLCTVHKTNPSTTDCSC